MLHSTLRTRVHSSFGHLHCTWPRAVKEPHPGAFPTCSLSYTNDHTQYNIKCRVQRFPWYLLKTKTGVPALYGHLSWQIHYGKQTAWCNTERIWKHWMLSNVHNCRLRQRWPLGITQLRSHFRAWSLTVEFYSKFCVDPYPKCNFYEKPWGVDFYMYINICGQA